ncbi:MAG: Flp pilus assembly protein CpaB [Planctomycetes bacterium RBG_16_64_12]|nr:MAG: Flp pilus assembly protein CpaB [Planctomycetes bacterium RBG_16_64_12]
MRTKSVLLLMLALGCGLVASIGITQVMAKRSSGSPAATGETQSIFVALTEIPRGDLITAEMLKLEEWPSDKVPPGALTKIEDVEGRRPKSKVYAGSVLLDDQLLAKGLSNSGAPSQIPVGYRVVSVRVDDESGISNLIRPSDRVDVLLYMRRSPGAVAETSTRTILQDIQVFAVNDVFDLETTEDEQTINAKTVSLLVTPGQAESITLATELGIIRLALRSHEDKEQAKVDGAFPHQFGETEASNRDKEELTRNPPPTSGSQELGGFLDLLNSRRMQEPSPPAVVASSEQWTMQLIKGPQISEVVMEMVDHASTPQAPGAKSSGLNFWRLISPVKMTGTDTAGAAADTDAGRGSADLAAPEADGRKAEEGEKAEEEDTNQSDSNKD